MGRVDQAVHGVLQPDPRPRRQKEKVRKPEQPTGEGEPNLAYFQEPVLDFTWVPDYSQELHPGPDERLPNRSGTEDEAIRGIPVQSCCGRPHWHGLFTIW